MPSNFTLSENRIPGRSGRPPLTPLPGARQPAGNIPDTAAHQVSPRIRLPTRYRHARTPPPGGGGGGAPKARAGWGVPGRSAWVSLRRRGWGGGGRRIGIPCAGDCGNHYAPRPGFSPGLRNRYRRNPADYRVSGIQNGSSRSSTNIHSSLHPQSVSARARRSSTSPVSE